ncbi:hypothetical protein T09_22 [Trichinella sp. T9]|nr:hypothetical protein T09_22 [Trichinella sp. T9]
MVERGGRWYNGAEWVVGGVGWMKDDSQCDMGEWNLRMITMNETAS